MAALLVPPTTSRSKTLYQLPMTGPFIATEIKLPSLYYSWNSPLNSLLISLTAMEAENRWWISWKIKTSNLCFLVCALNIQPFIHNELTKWTKVNNLLCELYKPLCLIAIFCKCVSFTNQHRSTREKLTLTWSLFKISQNLVQSQSSKLLLIKLKNMSWLRFGISPQTADSSTAVFRSLLLKVTLVVSIKLQSTSWNQILQLL